MPFICGWWLRVPHSIHWKFFCLVVGISATYSNLNLSNRSILIFFNGFSHYLSLILRARAKPAHWLTVSFALTKLSHRHARSVTSKLAHFTFHWLLTFLPQLDHSACLLQTMYCLNCPSSKNQLTLAMLFSLPAFQLRFDNLEVQLHLSAYLIPNCVCKWFVWFR